MHEIKFAEFTLDLKNRTLLRNNELVPIGYRCFDLLAYLIKRRQNSVTTAELRSAVWNDVELSPAAIATTVLELRRILGDSVSHARFIATHKQGGYRFVAHASIRRLEPQLESLAELRMIGREAQLSLLDSTLRTISNRRQSQIVVLRGEAGIGKTRILNELLGRNSKSAKTLLLRCSRARADAQHSLILDILATTPHTPPTTHLFSILEMTSESESSISQPNAPLGTKKRQELFQSFTEVIRQIAGNDPLIIAIEDIHLADRLSLHAIAWAIESLSTAPVAAILSQRPTAISEATKIGIDDILSSPATTTIDLEGLTAEETHIALEEPFGLNDILDANRIHQVTNGNPLLILHEIHKDARRRQKMGPIAHKNIEIALDADLVTRMMLELPQSTRQSLSFRATSEDGVSLAALAAAQGIPIPQAEKALEVACRARLLSQPSPTFTFAHRTLKDAIVSSTEPWENRRIHSRLATALQNSGEHCAPSTVATHMARSVPLSSPIDSAQQCAIAALDAIDRLRFEEARSFAATALEFSSRDPNTSRQTLLEHQLLLARALSALGRRGEARQQITDSIQLARSFDSISALTECALRFTTDFALIDVGMHDITFESLLRETIRRVPVSDPRTLAILYARLSLAVQWGASQIAQDKYVSESNQFAQRSGDPAANRESLSALSESLHGPALATKRLETLSRIRSLPKVRVDHADLLLEQTRRISALLEAGEISQIVHENEEYRRLADQSGLPHHMWYAITTDVMLDFLKGELSIPAKLDEHFERIQSNGDNPNVIQGYAVQKLYREAECLRFDAILPSLNAVSRRYPLVSSWRAALAWFHWNVGNENECLRILETFTPQAILAMSRQAGAGAGLAMITEVAAQYGSVQQRRFLYDAMLPIGDRGAAAGYAVLYFGTYYRYGGILAQSLGMRREARNLLAKSVEIETSRNAELWRGYSLIDLALAQDRGARGQKAARDHLDSAQRIAKALDVPRLSHRLSTARAIMDR